ncbi:MAG: DUF2065 domain-containing protein [Geminicoccaceae bacterium]|nr:MAG: DUF2065 domain-containing protein [Geminicoccaceae bacterium]
MELFFVALGLVLVLEGLLWAGFPNQMKAAAERLLELPASVLRQGGLVAMAAGVLIIWWVRG